MPEHGAAEAFLAGNLAGFSLGVVISTLLLVLTLRAVRLPGTPFANISLALCAILWNIGGLALSFQTPPMIAPEAVPSVALAVQFTGAALWPLPLLAIWRHMAVTKWQCWAWRVLQGLGCVHAFVLTTGMWMSVAGWNVPVRRLAELAAYDGTFLLVAAAILLFRGKPASRALLFSVSIVFAGLLVTTLSVILGSGVNRTDWVTCILGVTGKQSLLLVVIGTFFLFARFRFADILIHYTVRLFLASICACILVLSVSLPAVRAFAVGGFVDAGRFIATFVLSTAMLMIFPPLDRLLRRLIDHLLFHAPDYREASRRMGDAVRGLYSEPDVTAAVEREVRSTLALSEVRSIPLASLAADAWPPEIHEAHFVEPAGGSRLPRQLDMPDLELLVPVRVGGMVTAVLAVAPGPARRTLVSHEVNYLRSVALQLGTRLDLLRLEAEMADRRNRETVLQQQVTEAELRALRAQINPHFLFNSLNTIANLIATDPPRAEVMTLRLARVFRHVLANSSKQMVTVREEMEFLRTYLDIEEARFGNRLQIQFDVAPEVAQSAVPSLILQPVVENALRHGLGRRPGPGHLKISAVQQGDLVCLAVEDNGVGPDGWNSRTGEEGGGLGLRNILQRLTALYRNSAQLSIQSAIPHGTRVTLLLPLQTATLQTAALQTAALQTATLQTAALQTAGETA